MSAECGRVAFRDNEKKFRSQSGGLNTIGRLSQCLQLSWLRAGHCSADRYLAVSRPDSADRSWLGWLLADHGRAVRCDVGDDIGTSASMVQIRHPHLFVWRRAPGHGILLVQQLLRRGDVTREPARVARRRAGQVGPILSPPPSVWHAAFGVNRCSPGPVRERLASAYLHRSGHFL